MPKVMVSGAFQGRGDLSGVEAVGFCGRAVLGSWGLGVDTGGVPHERPQIRKSMVRSLDL